MILPYKDINPTNSFPYVTVAIIAANAAMFLGQTYIDFTVRPGYSVLNFGLRPVALLHPAEAVMGVSPILTLFLSMFMHAGILHIAGNMLYLWIYGDNVEDVMGHGLYLMFYLTGGLLASFTHVLFNPTSNVPMIGASGAVAAVLGAYLVFFPHAKVKTLVWIFIFITVVYLPAWTLIGLFVAINLIMGMASLASPSPGGVAWFAHMGGLAFGVAVAIPFRSRLRHARINHVVFNQWPNEWRL
ncbi:MAG: rhomboid family intramembrane serine protease [Candidatus Coatesbacteria bacterium]|nr:MAG: rhomboid family intramembrane serine protease [Candidatus Coatesbacteria bacterium]